MARPRIHVAAPLASGELLQLPEDAFRHVVQVLRLRLGEALLLFNGEGGEYEALLESAGKREAAVRIGARIDIDREAARSITLAQAVSKGERMDFTLQKAVELGVSAIQPLITERCVVRLDGERWEKKLEHWRGIVVAACEQSGRTRIPALQPVMKFGDWLPTVPADTLRLTLAPNSKTGLRELPPQERSLLLIGPEGGLSDSEIAQAARAGFTAIHLGPRVLRTETAALACLAAMQALWGDLG